ncbi:MAG: 3-deoxy-manno-octulosonate cytidylyltransferase [Deltaproteobacteria bacterium]
MKVAAIIPARWGSTRLNGKPLADIGGKPMVRWVYERASAARLVEYVAVATDDERIEKAVRRFGGNVVMTSPFHRSGTDRVAEPARKTQSEIVVNLQGDEPLIEPSIIDEAIRPMLQSPDIQLCTLKTRIVDEEEYHNPNVVKVVTGADGFALYFSRSPIPHMKTPFKDSGVNPYKHIGLYVYRMDFLLKFAALAPTALEEAESLEQLRALEHGCRIKVVEAAYNPVSVDTAEDLERVRRIMAGPGV